MREFKSGFGSSADGRKGRKKIFKTIVAR